MQIYLMFKPISNELENKRIKKKVHYYKWKIKNF